MPKHFEKFSELIEWKNKCPVCNRNLTYKITTSIFNNSNNKNLSIKVKLENRFNKILNLNSMGKQISKSFNPLEANNIEISETDIIFMFNDNFCLVDKIESVMNAFSLDIYCNHDQVGKAYEAKGSFDFDTDFNASGNIPKENGKYKISISDITIDYEFYKIINVRMEDEKPNGFFIKIINDFCNNKTSFSFAETNLDGSFGSWKEKRMDLVDDNFFKFNEAEKIYSRLNTIFLLK